MYGMPSAAVRSQEQDLDFSDSNLSYRPRSLPRSIIVQGRNAGGSTNKSIRGILFLIIYLAVWAAIFFCLRGPCRPSAGLVVLWPQSGTGTSFQRTSLRVNPDLIGERMKPGPGEQDRVFKIASTVLSVLLVVLAGLDVGRYHWTAPVSSAAQITALVIVLLGYALLSWALLINRFFSSAVRLQPDRQQAVVDKGPYAYVRHPGYAGAIPYMVFTGLALGSWLVDTDDLRSPGAVVPSADESGGGDAPQRLAWL